MVVEVATEVAALPTETVVAATEAMEDHLEGVAIMAVAVATAREAHSEEVGVAHVPQNIEYDMYADICMIFGRVLSIIISHRQNLSLSKLQEVV